MSIIKSTPKHFTKRNISFFGLVVLVIAVFLSYQEIYRSEESPSKTTPILNQRSTLPVQEMNGVKFTEDPEFFDNKTVVENAFPAIENPKFDSVKNTTIPDTTLGIGVEINGVTKFYPLQILVWHGIVNDYIDKTPILVSFCPVCLSGVVYDRTVDGEPINFENSKFVWNGNLLAKDTTINPSYWSTLSGEAIVGEKSGALLRIVASTQTTLGEWRRKNPETLILNFDTGYLRPYMAEISDIDTLSESNKRLNELYDYDDFVLGIKIGTKFKAYPLEYFHLNDLLEDTFEESAISIKIVDDKFIVLDENGEKVDYVISTALIWSSVFEKSVFYEQ